MKPEICTSCGFRRATRDERKHRATPVFVWGLATMPPELAAVLSTFMGRCFHDTDAHCAEYEQEEREYTSSRL